MTLDDKLFLVKFKKDEKSHLVIVSQDTCKKCETKPCTKFCPALVYKEEADKISVAYEGCLECGSCRIGCLYSNIDWRYPRGGFGVTYRYG
ncbi:MAG: 4Fe-4S dicluster domain-containing protein [Candidatus Firestonebacteria bacterium]